MEDLPVAVQESINLHIRKCCLLCCRGAFYVQVTINRDGQQMGPYTIEQINEYLAQGSLLPTDHAWHEGLPDWVPVTQISGVDSAAASPPFTPKPEATAINRGVPQEELIHEDQANLKIGIGRGGHLRLTTSKLIFTPHSLNDTSEITEIPLSDISRLEECWTKLLGIIPIVPNILNIHTHAGEEFKFQVLKRSMWITLLEKKKTAFIAVRPWLRLEHWFVPRAGVINVEQVKIPVNFFY